MEARGAATVPRRQLGRELRRLRERARIPQAEAVRRLECSVSRLWRLESGELTVRSLDEKVMCEVYGADAKLTEALVALAPQTKADGWWHDYGSVPSWFEVYIRLEEAACRIREYQPELVPG